MTSGPPSNHAYAALNNHELEAMLLDSPEDEIRAEIAEEIANRIAFLREFRHDEEERRVFMPDEEDGDFSSTPSLDQQIITNDETLPFTMYYFIQDREGNWVRNVSVATDANEDCENACIICLDKVADCRFVNHIHSKNGYMCWECATRILSHGKKCPLCRGHVSHYEAILLPVIQEAVDEVLL